ncbi:MAG: hypothetical protein M1835_001662 [Candelina submexicana]|nr:MAG: hypothetical protein M1835_001662 [Candelina submexicana]
MSIEKRFEYLTPIPAIHPSHFCGTSLLASRSFHLLAGPSEVIKQTKELLLLRQKAGIEPKPLIVWEPMPSSCHKTDLETFYAAARTVDVFSPNHVELAAIFGNSAPEDYEALRVKEYASAFVSSGVGAAGQGAVVIRAGEHGCFITSTTQIPKWLPPYYNKEAVATLGDKSSDKVVDPTGAGNAFLGGFAIGLLESQDLYQAACYGNVSASFALEQIGPPDLTQPKGSGELWKGVSTRKRLNDYKSKLNKSNS